jgi:YggT family protein
MGTEASLAMLCSVVSTAMQLVSVSVFVYSMIILLYILSTWVPLPYNRALNSFRRFLFDACDPYLRLFRRVVPPLWGRYDFSPIIAIVALGVFGYAVNTILAQFG